MNSRRVWSPDGKKIAFTSDRHGNDDVFVLHLDTGTVQRLTYFSGRDRAWGWTPDSRAVLFESRRESEPYGADFSAYVAPLDGGTPYRLHKASGSPFALSPDGKRLAFVRRDSAWWRKGYKGSAQGDLWLLERDTSRYVRLTDTDTPDTFPMWGADGRTLYFVSERDGHGKSLRDGHQHAAHSPTHPLQRRRRALPANQRERRGDYLRAGHGGVSAGHGNGRDAGHPVAGFPRRTPVLPRRCAAPSARMWTTTQSRPTARSLCSPYAGSCSLHASPTAVPRAT
jgi:Tol biopolymer transport system component